MFGSILYLLEEIKVEKVIIGKQFENSANYEAFSKIVKEKRIRVSAVEIGQRINIEKDLYFDILWPDSESVINNNILNNNSLVCKMVSQDISILFTGDIEEIAEKAILKKYKDTNILKSTILKVAHHGSKTSSTERFLNIVKPKVVLIGVGENNIFDHPNDVVLKRLKRMWK